MSTYRKHKKSRTKAHQANQLYPFAVSLTESVNTYGAVCARVDERPQLKTLLAERRNELIRLVHEGADLVWDSYKLESYTQRFQDHVFTYQEKVDDLICLDDTITREVRVSIFIKPEVMFAPEVAPYRHKSM